ncbi:MAG: DUF924 domain-containing protein [Proteobacteria bacterium]|nr:MAG: DUF924 domain-containing protein [Pseudomonadota bacterium]TDJ68452.1 MAG: DUF924 domain-containing protein [Pseudomonadota bacterium]
MTRIEEILSFWFGEIDADGLAKKEQAERWFRANAETDELIRERFASDLQKAIQGQLTSWEQYPRGRLALIVLLGQFSRNIYRGTAQAFAQDELALSLCLQGIDIGHDLALRPIERTFYYLPMEHPESLQIQDRCVQHYQQLVASVLPATTKKLQSSLDYAISHRDIIARFGRFPHRNKLLGRASTAAEREYLSQGGATFGQK